MNQADRPKRNADRDKKHYELTPRDKVSRLDAEKRVDHRAVLPQIPTWINQKGSQSEASFPATRPVYGTVATDAPSRKGSQIRKL